MQDQDEIHASHWLLSSSLRKGLLLLGVFLALDILDLTVLAGAMLGTAGVVGLAIGFAFNDIIENDLAGLLLSVRRPFDIHYLVRIEFHMGWVRFTPSELVLMTLEGNHVRLPNAMVFKSFIYNYNIKPLRRFDFGVGVGVDEDLAEVQTKGCGVLREMAGTMADPAPFMRVEGLGDFNVLVRIAANTTGRSALKPGSGRTPW